MGRGVQGAMAELALSSRLLAPPGPGQARGRPSPAEVPWLLGGLEHPLYLWAHTWFFLLPTGSQCTLRGPLAPQDGPMSFKLEQAGGSGGRAPCP